MGKVVIFDLDGTLIDTIKDLATAVNYALQQSALPTHPTESYYAFVGHGIFHLFASAVPQKLSNDSTTISRIHKLFREYYDSHNAHFSTPYPGISELLYRLTQDGIMVAVASNKYQDATTAIVSRFFPNIPFVAVLGQRDNTPIKPDPTIVQEIAAVAGVDFDDIIYVGDSDVDIQTARNGGVKVIAVTWGFRDRACLEAELPDAIVESATELYSAIKSMYRYSLYS